MDEVVRFKPSLYLDQAMAVAEEGGYVRYEDYLSLQVKLEALKANFEATVADLQMNKDLYIAVKAKLEKAKDFVDRLGEQ